MLFVFVTLCIVFELSKLKSPQHLSLLYFTFVVCIEFKLSKAKISTTFKSFIFHICGTSIYLVRTDIRPTKYIIESLVFMGFYMKYKRSNKFKPKYLLTSNVDLFYSNYLWLNWFYISLVFKSWQHSFLGYPSNI